MPILTLFSFIFLHYKILITSTSRSYGSTRLRHPSTSSGRTERGRSAAFTAEPAEVSARTGKITYVINYDQITAAQVYYVPTHINNAQHLQVKFHLLLPILPTLELHQKYIQHLHQHN